MGILLGCIADDFTGATDLASTLARAGMRVVQHIGIPAPGDETRHTDAAVVSLKSRTIPAAEAVRQSLAALDWLRRSGARQFFFKYCSTFDSTEEGNIGPVLAALLAALNSDFTIACPAFPANGRTVYQGHLFVGEMLLSESGMRHHPLTPMTDANLVRVLGRQMKGSVGLVPFGVVDRNAEAIGEACASLRDGGIRCAIVDALSDEHLHTIGAACADLPLVTGGSGVATGLPENFRRAGVLQAQQGLASLPATEGYAAVLAGSCSAATRTQVETMKQRHPWFRIDASNLMQPDLVATVLAWAADWLPDGPVLIYSSAAPDEVAALQARLGPERAGALIEETLARVANALVGQGVRRLVVAGGETSGAVVSALGVKALHIGPEIAPGVAWTICTHREPVLCLALKSGNFGADDFFIRALEMA
jgi:3-dehydrotetronate 4-kinase